MTVNESIPAARLAWSQRRHWPNSGRPKQHRRPSLHGRLPPGRASARTLKLELAYSRWARTAGLTMRRMTKNIRRRLRLIFVLCFRSVELAAAIDMNRLARHVGIRHDH